MQISANRTSNMAGPRVSPQPFELDTGAAQRNLHNLAAAYATCKIFGLRNVIDIGGGNGLLCRLLRDYRINCFANDPNAIPHYNQNYTEPDFSVADMLTAFEVIEHFPNPASDLETIFGEGAPIVLISTNLYEYSDRDWWYLAPEGGNMSSFTAARQCHRLPGNTGIQLCTIWRIHAFRKTYQHDENEANSFNDTAQ